MARTLTAADIKQRVKATLKAYGRKLNDKDVPHHFNDSTARMAIDEAKAYLNDSRYEVSPRSAKAIVNWCSEIKYY